MAGSTKTLPVFKIISCPTFGDWQDVIGMCVTLPAAYFLAVLTLIGVADQHRHTPLLVSVAAIPSLVSVGPLLWLLDAAKARRLE
jgi:hypothetical protein